MKKRKKQEVLKMKTTVQAWGNSSGVRIPAAFKKVLAIENGEEVEMRIENNALIIEKIKSKEWTLEELMDKYDASTEHKEVDFGIEGEELI
jgi:antitoxin MazE